MTDVYGRVAPGRSIPANEFADLTDKTVTSVTWVENGFMRVSFNGYLSEDTKRAVRRRMGSISRHEEILRNYLDSNGKIMDAWDALNPNSTSLSQVAGRLEVMTREVRTLYRLLRLLDNETYTPPPMPPMADPADEPPESRAVSGLAIVQAGASAVTAQA